MDGPRRTQELLDQQTLTEFSALARRGVERGVLRPDLEIDTLYELVIGTAFYAAVVQSRNDIDELVDNLCSLVIRGARREDSQ